MDLIIWQPAYNDNSFFRKAYQIKIAWNFRSS